MKTYLVISASLAFCLFKQKPAQQLLQLVLVHPPQLEEALTPPAELFPVLKVDKTFPASFPQTGHLTLSTSLLQSSSIFLWQSEQ
jgi:hypothetical protein